MLAMIAVQVDGKAILYEKLVLWYQAVEETWPGCYVVT